MQAPNAKSNGISLSYGLEGWLPTQDAKHISAACCKAPGVHTPHVCPKWTKSTISAHAKKALQIWGHTKSFGSKKVLTKWTSTGSNPSASLAWHWNFLFCSSFFRLGAEQHIKVLGQVIGPSPQFQIIMNHIPAIWFQIWAKHVNCFLDNSCWDKAMHPVMAILWSWLQYTSSSEIHVQQKGTFVKG